MNPFDFILSEYGAEMAIAFAGIFGSVIGYFTSRQKQNNQFILEALREVNIENQGDKEYLVNRLKEKEAENDELKLIHIECEKNRGLQEVEVQGLKNEIDILSSFIDKPEMLKKLLLDSKRRRRKLFKHILIDDILAKVQSIPDRQPDRQQEDKS
ncbi:hypothetical protein [Spirulina sp. 06S082]|uniref:hypothetical protein n=1 Tax=Spirulina sp. 06S082 TaxID=3110248 RepID=UPI002B20B84A|nr:hypothetical protein [Spirulina sp. 06S082]MEA5467993.1 hypothetical protein [Spirulina sp. 06S082]